MKTKLQARLAALTLVWLSTLNAPLSTVFAQGTAFTYQGRLNSGAAPAGGNYDLRFAIYDAPGAGTQQGNAVTNSATAVSNGLFTVLLDFGAGVFPGAARWLEIAARTNGGGAFTNLSPRQQLTAAPYAITAGNVTGSLPASQLTGTIPLAQLPTSVVTNGATGVSITGTFSGNGAGVTNVNLSNVNSQGALAFTTNYSGIFTLTSSPGVGIGPQSVTSADVNGDGKVDLISANLNVSTLSVLTNNGSGSFVWPPRRAWTPILIRSWRQT